MLPPIVVLSVVCFASTAKSANSPDKPIDQPAKESSSEKGVAEEAKKIAQEALAKANEIGARAGKDFAGLHFGAGVAFTRTFGRDRIETAINDNGIVRVDGEKNAIPRVMLETHFFLTPKQWSELFSTWDYSDNEKGKFGVGPFVAIQPGSDLIIQAIAVGLMAGFKDPIYKDASHSWNIGLGISVEPSSKTLGDGLKPNEPVPTGATVRTQSRSLAGFTALVSYGW